jgi:anti-sigma regulatory factor (Ser/Thr protein kinase)
VTHDPPATTEPDAAGTVPPGVTLDQAFDSSNLFALRSAVAAHGSDLGLTPHRVADLVLAAQELAANAVRHGGAVAAAPGRLFLWREDNRVVCRVSDGGPGMANADGAGLQRADIGASAGRGLWIVRQIVDTFEIVSRADGVTVTVTLELA